MKKITYNVVAYIKGNTGRKGNAKMTVVFDCMSDAIKKLQEWAYKYEDLYYYTINREITIKNE